jgi:hypothetical protein
MNFDKYLVHPHCLGTFITPTGKIANNETARKKVLELFIEETTGKRKEIKSKYLTKGTICEPEGFAMLQKTLYPDAGFLKKPERKQNEFLNGEADMIAPDDVLYDIKNAWDLFTFYNASFTHMYQWQGKAYLYLYAKEKFRLFYCVNNMPEYLLNGMFRALKWDKSYGVEFEDIEYCEEYINDCQEIRDNHNYDDMPLEERFNVWDLEITKEDILLIQEVVINVRRQLNQLWTERQARVEKNRRLMMP